VSGERGEPHPSILLKVLRRALECRSPVGVQAVGAGFEVALAPGSAQQSLQPGLGDSGGDQSQCRGTPRSYERARLLDTDQQFAAPARRRARHLRQGSGPGLREAVIPAPGSAHDHDGCTGRGVRCRRGTACNMRNRCSRSTLDVGPQRTGGW